MRVCVRKRASRAGKVGPDLNFGPDSVSSEPISKVASGNHGGNGNAVPPLVLSPPLNRANHNVGGTTVHVFCPSWASRGQHSDPHTRRASPRCSGPAQNRAAAKSSADSSFTQGSRRYTNDANDICDSCHLRGIWGGPSSLR